MHFIWCFARVLSDILCIMINAFHMMFFKGLIWYNLHMINAFHMMFFKGLIWYNLHMINAFHMVFCKGPIWYTLHNDKCISYDVFQGSYLGHTLIDCVDCVIQRITGGMQHVFCMARTFHKGFMSSLFKFRKYLGFYYSKNKDLIRPKFCKYRGSSAAVIFAKLWPDLIIRIRTRAKSILYEISVMSSWNLSEMGPWACCNHWTYCDDRKQNIPTCCLWGLQFHLKKSGI